MKESYTMKYCRLGREYLEKGCQVRIHQTESGYWEIQEFEGAMSDSPYWREVSTSETWLEALNDYESMLKTI